MDHTDAPQPAGSPAQAATDGETRTDGRLTKQQAAFFDAFGFLRLQGLFREEAARFSSGFDEIFARDEPYMVIRRRDDFLQQTESPRKPCYRNIIGPDFVERSVKLKTVLTDPRVVGIVTSLLGEASEYRGSDGHLYYCDTSWHYDAYGAPLDEYHVKLSFYLETLRADSGAIRVIPGTHVHESGFARKLQQTLYRPPRAVRAAYGVRAEEIPSWTVENEPGDVIVWSFRTMHASFNGRDGRRSFSLTYRAKEAPDHSAAEPGDAA